MSPKPLQEMIEAARQRMDELAQRVNGNGGPGQQAVLAQALEELSTALEELGTASEELSAQNDELIAARQMVEAERQRYQDLFDAAPCAYIITDSHGVIEEANSLAAATLGVPAATLVGKPLSVFVAAGDHRSFRTRLLSLRTQEASQTWELGLAPREGERTDVVVTVAGVRDADGGVIALRWIVRRFAERTELESRAHTINSFLQLFVQHAGRREYLDAVARLLREFSGCQCVGIRIRNEENEIPYEASIGFMPEFLQSESCLLLDRDRCACTRVVSGQYEPRDARAMTPAGAFCLNDMPGFLKALSDEDRAAFRGTCATSGFTSVAIIPLRRGERVEGAIHLADERPGMVPPSVVEFIEQMSPMIAEACRRFTVEKQLWEHEAQLEAFFNASITPIVFLDKEFNFVRVNEAYAQACRRDISEFAGRNHFDLYPSDAKAIFEEVVRTKTPYQTVGRPFLFPDQPQRGITYWDWSLVPILDENGDVSCLVYALADVTARTLAQDTARRTGELMEKLLSTPHIKIAYMDSRFTYLRVNAAFAELAGQPPEMLIGRHHFDLHPDEATQAVFQRVVETGQPYSAHAQPFPVGRHGEDNAMFWNWTVVPVSDAFGNVDGILLTLIDVTEQKLAEDRQASLQQQLMEAQKLDIIGRLAAGLAHDFSNLLTGISGHVSLANDIARHAQGITESLMTLAGRHRPEKALLDLCSLVKKTAGLLCYSLPPSIALETAVCEPPIWVHGNAVMLEQAITNLAANARQAMPKGGVLRIRLGPQKATGESDRVAKMETVLASLVVEDSGTGMPSEVAKHIFEPFFTTRPRGEGKGLGLPLVEAIVKDHAGSIEVESEPDKGTRFTILLPTVAPGPLPPQPATVASTPVDAPREHGKLVLLAESDRHVRGVVAMALQPLGCEVVQLGSGPTLLSTLDERREAARLIILDEDLPGRNGRECLTAIRSAGGTIPVILMTRNDEAGVRAEIGRQAMVVRKPFQLPELERLVRQALTT